MGHYTKHLNDEEYLSIEYDEQKEQQESFDCEYLPHDVDITKVLMCHKKDRFFVEMFDISTLVFRGLIDIEDLGNEILDYLEA